MCIKWGQATSDYFTIFNGARQGGILSPRLYVVYVDTLNAQKTELMLFHRKQKHVNDVNIKIDNTMIEHVQTFNFLGIMLNETLSWKSHIDMVSNKISKVIGILYRLKHVFPEYVLFTLYNSLIVSYINYGLLLWGVDCHKLQSL